MYNISVCESVGCWAHHFSCFSPYWPIIRNLPLLAREMKSRHVGNYQISNVQKWTHTDFAGAAHWHVVSWGFNLSTGGAFHLVSELYPPMMYGISPLECGIVGAMYIYIAIIGIEMDYKPRISPGSRWGNNPKPVYDNPNKTKKGLWNPMVPRPINLLIKGTTIYCHINI